MAASMTKQADARRRALAYAETLSAEEDATITAAAETDLDNPPLTDDDFTRMKPARGRPRGDVPKVPVTIRLDADVVEAFKGVGRGWQTSMNSALRKAAFTPGASKPDKCKPYAASGLIGATKASSKGSDEKKLAASALGGGVKPKSARSSKKQA